MANSGSFCDLCVLCAFALGFGLRAMNPPPEQFVDWFRSAAPYINAFRGRTFVIAFGGEVVADGKFVALTHDLNLLASLGVRLVLVHGARPQIEAQLKARGIWTGCASPTKHRCSV